MSIVTFQVMHLGSFGYLGYCNYVLDNCLNVYFVRIIHLNTSSLEVYFSLMRWYGADTAAKYESTINIVDNQKSMSRLKSSGMYDPHEERYIKRKSLTGNKSKEREKMVLECEKISDSEISVLVFDICANEDNFYK